MSTPNGRRGRKGLVAVGASLLLVIFATVASAAHWPFYGGDAGRSGYQPLDEGSPPITKLYVKADDKPVKTSIVNSTGAEGTRRMAYGTETAAAGADGNVHVQVLSTGAAVGPEAGQDIEDGANDGDTFQGKAGDAVGAATRNPNAPGSVTPVSSSGASGLGMLFVLHNDDNQDGAGLSGANEVDPRTGNDIALAIVNETTGAVTVDKTVGASGLNGSTSNTNYAADVAKPNTVNYTVSSSPLLTAPAGDGSRDLFFVASRAAADADTNNFPCDPTADFDAEPVILRGCSVSAKSSLFKLHITSAGTVDANFADEGLTAVDVPSVNTIASPTLVNLGGVAHIAVAGSDGNVRFFKAEDLSAATAYTIGGLGVEVMTPSAPVAANGSVPTETKSIFVAANTARSSTSAPRSEVFRLDNDGSKFVIGSRSGTLSGEAAPALAVSAESATNGSSLALGRVVVTTANNLFSLRSDDLTRGNFLTIANNLARGTTGFSRTSPAISGGVIYVQNDQGEHKALDETTLDGVTFDPYTTENPAAANVGIGQPSVSARFVQFGGANGAFVYRAAPLVVPTPGTEGPGFSVNDVTIAEGNSGTTNFVFTITKTGPGAGTVTAQTADGSATAGSDYTALGATVVTFAANETTKTVSVPVNGDTTFEGDETFFVNLSAPTGTNAAIADGQGVGIITNDETTPGGGTGGTGTNTPLLSIGDVTVLEGTGGNGQATITLNLSNASATAVTVDVASASNSATTAADFVAFKGTITFAPGETSKALLVNAIGDSLDEPTERYYVNLSNAKGATIADGQGAVLIIDDDGTSPYSGPKVNPKGLSAKVTPTRDKKAPFRFTTTGKLTLPTGMTQAQGCTGKVQVQVKTSGKTISTRSASLKSNCTYSNTVSFRNRKRFAKNGKLQFAAKFLGNTRLNTISAPKKITVRTK